MGCRLSHALRLQFSVTCEDRPDLNLKKSITFRELKRQIIFWSFDMFSSRKYFWIVHERGLWFHLGKENYTNQQRNCFKHWQQSQCHKVCIETFQQKRFQKNQKHDQTNGVNNLLSITSLPRWAWRQSFVIPMTSAVNNHATIQIKQTAVKLFTNTCAWKNSTNHRG